MSIVIATESRDGSAFHEPGCHFAGSSRPENRVHLDSADEAEEQGFKPCKFCFPERREAFFRRGGSSPASSPAPEKPVHERGVYAPQYIDTAGHEVFVAIDSQGRAIARVSVVNEYSRDSVLRFLRAILDDQDPVGWKARQQSTARRGNLELIH